MPVPTSTLRQRSGARRAWAHLTLLAITAGVIGAAEPTLRPWTTYQTILWMGAEGQKGLAHPRLPERLRELGISAGMAEPEGDGAFYRRHGLAYYVENIVNEGLCLKFRSRVTDWDAFIRGWMDTRDPRALVRDYALEDPAWLQRMAGRVQTAARRHAAGAPLLYDLRDELSTTISANPFDYDFSDTSLAAFRAWLRTRYPSLAALNSQWETSFPTWDEVRPFTTDQIKQRMATGRPGPDPETDWGRVRAASFRLPVSAGTLTRWNFAPWADHRTYMDHALAAALAQLRAASREIDPATPVGIEGTQMPHAFGGYDLWRLSRVLDWVEPYDIANAREIFGAFLPGRPILTTVFEKETRAAERRLWHLLLEGDRGCIVWWSEDVIAWREPDIPLTPKARALAPVLQSLHTPLAQLFLRAERERDPLFLHYSQPSIQVAWLLESIPDGRTWVRRFSSFEADHNRHARVRDAWLKVLQDFGFSPTFLAAEQLEAGVPADARLLVLPQSWAMSERERAAAAELARRAGCAVIADGPAGAFDAHGTLRRDVAWPSATDQAPEAVRQTIGRRPDGREISTNELSLAGYAAQRRQAEFPEASAEGVRRLLAELALSPPVEVPPSARVRVHRFRVGNQGRLLAFERNIDYRMREELRQSGGNEALERPLTFPVRLSEPAAIINLRTGERLGHGKHFTVSLDPWQPALFAVLSDAPSGDVVAHLLSALTPP